MASSAGLKMDVDNPLTLKRSSSAPMINELNTSSSTQTPQAPNHRETSTMAICPSGVVRTRRFSTSCTPLSGPSSPKMTHRVDQLRREESVVDVLGREAAHERELNSAMVMSQSWEDLTLVTEPNKNEEGSNSKGAKGLELPLAGPGTPPLRSTPSPTTPLRHFSLKTSLTPSPTKFRRSQSPIGAKIKPSVLGNSVKRKFELEENDPPAKKISSLYIQQARFEPVVIPNRGSECFDKIQTSQETACAQSGGSTD